MNEIFVIVVKQIFKNPNILRQFKNERAKHRNSKCTN